MIDPEVFSIFSKPKMLLTKDFYRNKIVLTNTYPERYSRNHLFSKFKERNLKEYPTLNRWLLSYTSKMTRGRISADEFLARGL